MGRDFCSGVGIGYVDPPEYTSQTVERGVAISPEHFCFPMKVLLGSSMECLEAGADTLVTVAGYGACRFNYFAELQRRILEREGYSFQMVAFDSPRDSPLDFYRNLRTVTRAAGISVAEGMRALSSALHKGWARDEAHKRSVAVRAIESVPGSTDEALRDCLGVVDAARSSGEIEAASEYVRSRFDGLAVEEDRPHIKVALVGEILMSMEPFFNMDAERWLTDRGAVVERSIYMSDLFSPMGRNPVRGWTDSEMEAMAKPYLCHEIGGHGQINVAAAAEYARRGFDAVLHLFPFTCLPEVIARTVFVRISRDFGMPILSMSIDEQTGRAGTQTRYEALLDLAWARARNVSNPKSTHFSRSTVKS